MAKGSENIPQNSSAARLGAAVWIVCTDFTCNLLVAVTRSLATPKPAMENALSSYLYDAPNDISESRIIWLAIYGSRSFAI